MGPLNIIFIRLALKLHILCKAKKPLTRSICWFKPFTQLFKAIQNYDKVIKVKSFLVHNLPNFVYIEHLIVYQLCN